jgi:hypothetical protein
MVSRDWRMISIMITMHSVTTLRAGSLTLGVGGPLDRLQLAFGGSIPSLQGRDLSLDVHSPLALGVEFCGEGCDLFGSTGSQHGSVPPD